MDGTAAATVLVFCDANGTATELAERVLARIFDAEGAIGAARTSGPRRAAPPLDAHDSCRRMQRETSRLTQ